MFDLPRSKIFDDIYFSPENGMKETRHVFIEGNKLTERFIGTAPFVICETGFGTGLNFIMACQAAGPNPLHYISFEKYPLQVQEIEAVLSVFFGPDDLEGLLRNYPLEQEGWVTRTVSETVTLTLIFGDMNDEISKLKGPVDAWFLDGFAPSKNPDMWTETLFLNMARLSHKGTTFATFTAAGFVRRSLQAVGFHVQKVKGYGRKREMLCGEYHG